MNNDDDNKGPDLPKAFSRSPGKSQAIKDCKAEQQKTQQEGQQEGLGLPLLAMQTHGHAVSYFAMQ